jgi:putative transposase
VAFIAEHVDARHEDADGPGLRWGVESICEQLTVMGCKIAPASYYEHRGRTPTAREVRDAELRPKIAAAHASNYGVFGARKVWLTLNRQRGADEVPIARCTVERLMAQLGLAGAVRGKVKRTTISDPRAPKPHDLVNRNFRPLAPDRLWVADFTYVSTWSGWCYTALVVDAYARRILGWSVATTMTSQLVLDAVDQAVWTRHRDGEDLAGLIAHHDHGVQGGFNWPSQHLYREVEAWLVVSVRSRHALGRIEGRSRRRGRRRLPGVRIGSGSGPRSPAARGLRTHAAQRACRGRSGSAGFATLAG